MSLLTQASLVLTPNAVKASKLYSIIPSNGNGDMTVVRATTATRVNSSGLIESVAANVARLNYDGSCPSILVEPQRTNRLLNSDVVVTQSITTAGLQMAVSFYGTGTITFSGTFIGSLVGTGANNRVSIVFTPTTGTLVLTVTGSVTKGQVETGGYATSYIPTTIASVTRNADIISKAGISSLIGQTEGVVFLDFALRTNGNFEMDFGINNGTTTDLIGIFNVGLKPYISLKSNNVQIFLATTQLNNMVIGVNSKIAIAYKNNDFAIYQDGVQKFTQSSGNAPVNLNFLSISSIAKFYTIRNVILFKTRLTNTELAQLTTL